MFTHRITALATAILTAATIATAAVGTVAMSHHEAAPAAASHSHSVPAGNTTGTVGILAAGGPHWS